jgi:hypothetical protein
MDTEDRVNVAVGVVASLAFPAMAQTAFVPGFGQFEGFQFFRSHSVVFLGLQVGKVRDMCGLDGQQPYYALLALGGYTREMHCQTGLLHHLRPT